MADAKLNEKKDHGGEEAEGQHTPRTCFPIRSGQNSLHECEAKNQQPYEKPFLRTRSCFVVAGDRALRSPVSSFLHS
jgi:hypothetical protein